MIEGVLRNWLDDATEVDALTALDVHPLSDCRRIGYRIHGRDGNGPFVLEQLG